jgi:uncharacterized membrane protein YphA (DoxX/SURF4 family)
MMLMVFFPFGASAHEVYVLTPTEIQSGIASPAYDMFATAEGNLGAFLGWGAIAVITVFLVFAVSIIRPLERALDPYLLKYRKYAPAVARVTIGISFLAAAYYQATYGPELPLTATFGAFAPYVTALLVILGFLITLGISTRTAAFAALSMFTFAIVKHGSYMFTYTNYFGEILLLLFLGGHHGSVEGAIRWMEAPKHLFNRISEALAPYSMLILRVSFGFSLFYASAYAKILHNNLALQVASLPLAGHPYSLAHYFGMEPHFLVLGAAIVEIVIALFFIFGIEIRFTSLFLLFWLSLSLWYFGEVVWPHVILIGIPIAFLLYGYDKYSLEAYLFKRGDLEPVL